ncbi:MAG: hypothetical protein ACXWB9_03165 [Flavisolibacter sp.]
MLEDFQDAERKRITKTRSILDWVRGIFFFIVGVFFVVYSAGDMKILNREPGQLDVAIGSLFILYGGWRMYKGYKKDYFKNGG